MTSYQELAKCKHSDIANKCICGRVTVKITSVTQTLAQDATRGTLDVYIHTVTCHQLKQSSYSPH